MVYLAIFIGGAIGGTLRYFTSLVITNTTFPFSTLLINVLGAFLMGICSTYFINFFKSHRNIQKMITTGFIGAFTTYSSLSLDTVILLENGHILLASLYLSLNMLVGIVFLALGYKKGQTRL